MNFRGESRAPAICRRRPPTGDEIEGALVGSLVLDRFLIERRIGSGGFGTVYEAWDGRLERPVAVKAIDPGGSAGCDRVLREAQAAARLNHPGIVTLYEMGEEDGSALLVTELVDGDTLDQLNRDGELSDREIGEIGADLCEALDHAHSRSVVHRDIKPQNVLVTDDNGTRAKLMDFGVARITDATALTAPGDIVGTLAYMAPEQAEGREAGTEADVYSLALMLYECWPARTRTGARPRPPPRARSAPAPGRCAGPPRPAPRARAIGRRLPAAAPVAAPHLEELGGSIEDSLEGLAEAPAGYAHPWSPGSGSRRSRPCSGSGSRLVTGSALP